MSNCEKLSGYLERRLSGEERESFEQHLAGCNSCREATAKWQDVEQQIPGWLERTAHESPSSYEIQRLEALAQEHKAKHTAWGTWQTALATGAAAVLIVIIGAIYWYSRPDTEANTSIGPVAENRYIPPAAPTVPFYEAPEHEALRSQIDQDTIAVFPSGKARLTTHTKKETHIALEKGSIACQVARRSEGRSFSVQAGEFTVRVIGTKFLVTHSPGAKAELVVVVAEGTIQIASQLGEWTVQAGETFQFISADHSGNMTAASSVELALVERHLTSPTTAESKAVARRDAPKTPETRDSKHPRPKIPAVDEKAALRVGLAEARHWLADGRTAEAKTAVEDHLGQNPKDAAAWNLHGDCQRKARSWSAAVGSYDKAIAYGGARQASRARFMAAQVLQKNLADHKNAASYYEAYIASGKETVAMIDVARINLARSLIELGQKNRASKLLQEVIANQGDSFVATNARHLLKKID